jgi:prepilin-type N-terminal cleavage/methylation domain-containing protein
MWFCFNARCVRETVEEFASHIPLMSIQHLYTSGRARAAKFSASLKTSRRLLRGFTILEVMIAAMVMALVLTTSLTTLQSGFLALDSARKITLAGQIMQSEFEKMRLADWTAINAYPATSDLTPNITAGFGASAAITSTFTLTRTVAEVHTDMKQITLTMTWKGYDGRLFTRSYSTTYGQHGLYDYFYNSY